MFKHFFLKIDMTRSWEVSWEPEAVCDTGANFWKAPIYRRLIQLHRDASLDIGVSFDKMRNGKFAFYLLFPVFASFQMVMIRLKGEGATPWWWTTWRWRWGWTWWMSCTCRRRRGGAETGSPPLPQPPLWKYWATQKYYSGYLSQFEWSIFKKY